MPDLVRPALLLLSLGALLTSSVFLVGSWRLGGAGTVLALWIVGTGQIVLLAEALSLLRALDWPGFLLGHLLILGGSATLAARRVPADRWRALSELRVGLGGLARVVSDRRTPWLPILVAALLLVGLTCAFLALTVPPNNFDGLMYHASRVAYYLQFRSLDHYPTTNLRQVTFPANAELLVLWTVAFMRSDRLANTVQLAAWVVTSVGVYGLGRRAGLAGGAALLGAGTFALLPQAVLQSTTTHNDLVVASFVVASLYFLLEPRVESESGEWRNPLSSLTLHSRLALAGAAVGLALGTKGTAAFALPGLAVAGLLLCSRVERRLVVGLLLGGGGAAILLGSYIYVQNWYHYGSFSGSSAVSRELGVQLDGIGWQGFVANLARLMYTFAFADLSGPLAHPLFLPLTAPLTQGLAATGAWLFGALDIPTDVEGLDRELSPEFTFALAPRVHDYASGVGLVGGVILIAAVAVLVWPRRLPRERRLLALATLGYVAALSAMLAWSPFGGGRYLLTACALGAPLLAAVVAGQSSAVRTALALMLVVWSGVTGLYVAWFGEHKPVPLVLTSSRQDLMLLKVGALAPLFRELDRQLEPDAVVGVYGFPRAHGLSNHVEYPLFGKWFTRTLVPLVDAEYAERIGLRRPLAWTNDSLLAAYRPSYLLIQSPRPAVEAIPFLADRCVAVRLEHGKPRTLWELWRCRDAPAYPP